MVRTSFTHASFMGVILAVLIVAVPVSAYNVAIYGTSAGFDPTLHADSVSVIRSIQGSTGTDLDAAVDTFTQPSVDVIILGGNASFSEATAAKIEAAVAGGKILVITYPCNRLFNASLPALNGGSTPGGQYLEVANPTTAASQEIFRNLSARYTVQGTAPDKEQVVAKSGVDVLLNYDSGLPALLSWKYGNGAVIEWTTTPVPFYLNSSEADTITNRMLIRLLPTMTPVPTTILPLTSVTTEPQVNVTSSMSTSPTPTGTGTVGDISVYSSPTGASVLIDGIYYGTTPANLTGIAQGNHIIRLTQAGYYDYEGTIYIVPGQITHAFGTLPPLSQYSSAPTQATVEVVPVIVTVAPTDTPQEKGLLDNSSVLVALIGVMTALIAAGATVFTHLFKKKE
jgi:PEGA domain